MPNLLDPRTRLPSVDVALVSGGNFTVAEASPDNFQILVFYRGVHCPKCKKQLQALEPMVSDIRAEGHDIVAISMDSEDRARRAVTEWGLSELPVGYGLGLSTAKALGLFISDAISDAEPEHFSEPGVFVVHADGTLYAQIISNTPFGRPDMDDLVKGLNYAVENDYPARGTSVA